MINSSRPIEQVVDEIIRRTEVVDGVVGDLGNPTIMERRGVGVTST